MRLKFALPVLALILVTSTCLYSQSQQPAKAVSSADVIEMSQAGISDQIIIAKIKVHNQPSDLSTDDLVALKKAKVSDAVVAALIDPSATPAPIGTTVNIANPLIPAEHPSGATSDAPANSNDPMDGHDSGIYVYSLDHDGKPSMTELERTAYQGAKTGGLFTSALTYGIAKAKSKAIVPGKAASIRVGEVQPTFYFYFDSKAAGLGGNSYFAAQNISNPNQFALIRLKSQKSTREAEIGEFSMWGASSGNNKKDLVQFKSEKLKPGLYKVTLSEPLKAGEYCFMTAPIATSAYAGMAGTTSAANLFDFGVDR